MAGGESEALLMALRCPKDLLFHLPADAFRWDDPWHGSEVFFKEKEAGACEGLVFLI